MVHEARSRRRSLAGRLTGPTIRVPVKLSNWARNQTWSPAEALHPRSTDEIADIVRAAHAAGQRVKVIGGGHSFTAVAATDGVQLALDRLDRVPDLDLDRGQITVGAGIALRRLNDVLAEAGLAMPNLGDIDRQSIGGAIATATHGTGLEYGNLATTVVGMELVTGSGDVVRTSRRQAARRVARRPGRPRRAGHRDGGDAAVRAGVPPPRP